MNGPENYSREMLINYFRILHTCMHRSSDYSMRILKRLYMVGFIMIFATINQLRLTREERSECTYRYTRHVGWNGSLFRTKCFHGNVTSHFGTLLNLVLPLKAPWGSIVEIFRIVLQTRQITGRLFVFVVHNLCPQR